MFVIEFESKEDRDFYVKEDEAHTAFVVGAKANFEGVQVLDFTPGEF